MLLYLTVYPEKHVLRVSLIAVIEKTKSKQQELKSSIIFHLMISSLFS